MTKDETIVALRALGAPYALTIKQPFAQLIIDGVKPVENRHPATNYRGRIAIHAGKARDKIAPGDKKEYTFGAIIGTVTLYGCCALGAPDTPQWVTEDKYTIGPWCWLVRDPVKLAEPIPIKGWLGLWPVLADPRQND